MPCHQHMEILGCTVQVLSEMRKPILFKLGQQRCRQTSSNQKTFSDDLIAELKQGNCRVLGMLGIVTDNGNNIQGAINQVAQEQNLIGRTA
jgi:hypothetical protein